jgi:ABC-type antimicrobial peptide transport system permease subunit
MERGQHSKIMGNDGWIVETIFSCIKRRFDREYVYSVKLKNMIQEMILKVSLYNKLISV